MKNKVLRGKVYSKLIQRLFYQTIAMLGAAFVLVIVLREALRGNFANFMVWLIGIIWGRRSSDQIYQLYIRNNFDIIIVITMIAFFFILLRLSFFWFTNYFDQIVTGVDKLAEEADETIVMSSELKFMEIKLNEVKDKLKKRTEQAQVTANGKQIETDIKEDIFVYGDSEKLARVFNNILKNAIAYSMDNSTIYITAEAKPDKVVICFVNQGTIPKEQLNSIFEKFYRLDAARSSATGGAGLGLAIAKDIISLHGGTIRAESDNRCTTFSVELPVDFTLAKTP